MSKYHTTQTRQGSTGVASCFETHPPLPIGEYFIYGGSCSRPMVSNADIYVGFDYSMKDSPKQFPWVEGESFLYPIQDMGVPKDVESFKKLVEWLALQLIALKLVHIGCIGGHGRTGLVLSALVTHMTGELDSITYVRKHYCHKAVESETQVRFLHEHYGVTLTNGAKAHMSPYKAPKAAQSAQLNKAHATPLLTLPTGSRTAEPTKNPICIWGPSIKFVKPSKSATIEPI